MDNKQKIFDCALDLFYAKGYDAVGVQEIADAAGVTKPTLYHYFGSKYGLLESLVMSYYTQFSQRLRETLVYDGDLPVILCRAVKTYFHLAYSHQKIYMLVMGMMYSGEESETYHAVSDIRTEQFQMFYEVFDKAGDVIGNMNGRQAQYAVTFIGVINQYFLFCYHTRNLEQLLSDEKAFGVVHQFLHGIYV